PRTGTGGCGRRCWTPRGPSSCSRMAPRSGRGAWSRCATVPCRSFAAGDQPGGLRPLPAISGATPAVPGLVTARPGQPSAVPAPIPPSTYRLQLQPGFGFADATEIAGYLAALGVTHAYLSPILQAMPGSAHGYDVVDHSRLSARLGGEGGVRDMVASFPPHGLRGLGDVVRNHIA